MDESDSHISAARTALALAAAALLAALVSSTQLWYNWRSQGYPADWIGLSASKLVEWSMWAAFVPVIVRLERRRGFGVRPATRALAAHGVAAVGFFAVSNLVLTGLSVVVDPVVAGDAFGHAYLQRAGAKLVSTVVVYAAILCGWWLLRLREERHRQAAVSARLRADLSDARLLNLKIQIQPHFLFNTLHTVAGLVREGDRQTAIETIEELSELLRRALRDVEQQEVPLDEELDFLERYVRIQQLRFGDRLSVEVRREPDVADALVPSLILQPIVENAVRHGLDPAHGAGRVIVTAARTADELVLEVEDNGAGMASDLPREGLGLGNTRRRLEQLYGGRASLRVEGGTTRGTRVVIRVPHRRADRPALGSRLEPVHG